MQIALWIIDGNNFIRRDRTLAMVYERSGWGSACRVLEGELLGFRKRRGPGHSLVLVYDGAAPEATPPRVKGFRIVWSGADEEADSVILAEARRHEGRTSVNVVTSDAADIGRRLRGIQAEWFTVEDFASELRRGTPRVRPSASRPTEAVDKPPPPKGAELERWLEIFDPEAPDQED